MNLEDVNTAQAERGASPERFNDWDPRDGFRRHYSQLHPDQREQLDRQVTREESIASSRSSVQLQEIRTNNQARRQVTRAASSATGSSLGRTQTETERINRSERHPTALERIETHRSQHAHTIGPHPSRRASTTKSETPLPNFGAGKPFPPPLPAQEEYVVEFDSHDVRRASTCYL